jgi:gamma-glutamyltranspeptidase/glutathione hydrolase
MAASTHWLATATAQSVLERGGNAFDAVVAGGFVLQVVEPHLNGPGGDLVGIFQSPDDASPVVLCGQGPAPEGATLEHFAAEGLDLVPGAGALAAAVPGAFDAWLLLLRERGTWELADVLDYAIGYARDGHPLLAAVAATVERVGGLFAEHWTTSETHWSAARAGELFRNSALANVFERLASSAGDSREARIDAARTEWSTGFVAEAIDAFVRQPHRHSDGADHAGVIRAEDLARFVAHFEPAVTVDFRGHTVAKPGGWTQGPALLQALRLLDGFDDERLDPSTGLGAHTILEALKLALADRDSWYGDVDDLPLDTLLSPEYAHERRALISDVASSAFRPGTVDGTERPTPPLYLDGEQFVGAGEPTVSAAGVTRGDTCQIDVVDRWGNIVAVTPSGGWLQSSPTIPELGFCLGTRLQMTWLEPGTPSTLTPGKRPRTTLTPTLVLRDGRPVAALGSPGGDQQDQWQLAYLLRTIVGGYEPQQAIDAPAFHTESFPSSFWPRTWQPGSAFVEGRLGGAAIAELIVRGHDVTVDADWSLGRISVVGIDPERDIRFAAANPRGAQGYAAGR